MLLSDALNLKGELTLIYYFFINYIGDKKIEIKQELIF